MGEVGTLRAGYDVVAGELASVHRVWWTLPARTHPAVRFHVLSDDAVAQTQPAVVQATLGTCAATLRVRPVVGTRMLETT